MNIVEILKIKGREIDLWLDKLMPTPDQPPQKLHEAMRYSVFAGGKRLRPILAVLAYEWTGGIKEIIYPPACAIELIHAYSLIHDDLPGMDNDDLRRGKPTCHKVFGEAIALLAGDALHDLAFELLAMAGKTDIVVEVAKGIGTSGLVGGQVDDMLSENIKPTAELVDNIHIKKTAALIVTSVKIGAMMGEATIEEITSISEYALKMGLAFQIIDDILDITADEQHLGKPIGSDIEKGKATYPAIFGLNESKKKAGELIKEAKLALPDNRDNEIFYEIADFILKRAY